MMGQKNDAQFLAERLNQYPKLRERVEALLNVVENTAGDCTKADDAEQYVVDELRKMGNDALHCWAKKAASKATEDLRKQEPDLRGNGKKEVYWHTTLGKIKLVEQILRRPNEQIRPFTESAQIKTRRCSSLLQRVMTDFGADNAFGQVPNKLREHYGIEMPVSTVRKTTENHAQKILVQQETYKSDLKTIIYRLLVGGIDGCMVPIVEESKESVDKRKGKKTVWKESRLTLVHEQGSVTPKFRANFGGSVDDAGQTLRDCAIAAGFGQQSHIHVVGDGAPWIAEQVEDKFGTQATYLIDFYHVCEYLAEAAKICAPNETKDWIDIQKKLLKNNDYQTVLSNLDACINSDENKGEKTAVRACHRYLSRRINYLDYKGALEKGLPIGSGEIKSAHRYIIQKRLKLAGAWWKADNVNPMLALRVLRANGDWDAYWKNLSDAA